MTTRAHQIGSATPQPINIDNVEVGPGSQYPISKEPGKSREGAATWANRYVSHSDSPFAQQSEHSNQQRVKVNWTAHIQ